MLACEDPHPNPLPSLANAAGEGVRGSRQPSTCEIAEKHAELPSHDPLSPVPGGEGWGEGPTRHSPPPIKQITWHWTRFQTLGVDNLYDALALRCRVFILEQGPFLDPDGVDQQAWHLLGRDSTGALHAYLRVVDPGLKYTEPSIGRVITSLETRGTGLGRQLMHEGLARATAAWPGHGLRISAQARLEVFYASFGFKPVGQPYAEDGIPHLEMFRA